MKWKDAAEIHNAYNIWRIEGKWAQAEIDIILWWLKVIVGLLLEIRDGR